MRTYVAIDGSVVVLTIELRFNVPRNTAVFDGGPPCTHKALRVCATFNEPAPPRWDHGARLAWDDI